MQGASENEPNQSILCGIIYSSFHYYIKIFNYMEPWSFRMIKIHSEVTETWNMYSSMRICKRTPTLFGGNGPNFRWNWWPPGFSAHVFDRLKVPIAFAWRFHHLDILPVVPPPHPNIVKHLDFFGSTTWTSRVVNRKIRWLCDVRRTCILQLVGFLTRHGNTHHPISPLRSRHWYAMWWSLRARGLGSSRQVWHLFFVRSQHFWDFR